MTRTTHSSDERHIQADASSILFIVSTSAEIYTNNEPNNEGVNGQPPGGVVIIEDDGNRMLSKVLGTSKT